MYPALLLLLLMAFTWGAAVWASLRDDDRLDDRLEGPWESERSQKRAA